MRVEIGLEERPKFPPLTPEQEALVLKVEPFIRRQAAGLFHLVEMNPAALSIEDLEQSGAVGAIQAAMRFKPKKGKKFLSFAASRIRGAMIDEVRKLGVIPRSGTEVWQALDLLQQSERSSSSIPDEEIAQLTGFSVKRVRHARECLFPVSLDEIVSPGDFGEEGLTFLEAIADSTAEDPEQGAIRTMLRENLRAAINMLDKTRATVFKLYFVAGVPQSDIAEELGITESRVYQLCRQARIRVGNALNREDGSLKQPERSYEEAPAGFIPLEDLLEELGLSRGKYWRSGLTEGFKRQIFSGSGGTTYYLSPEEQQLLRKKVAELRDSSNRE